MASDTGDEPPLSLSLDGERSPPVGVLVDVLTSLVLTDDALDLADESASSGMGVGVIVGVGFGRISTVSAGVVVSADDVFVSVLGFVPESASMLELADVAVLVLSVSESGLLVSGSPDVLPASDSALVESSVSALLALSVLSVLSVVVSFSTVGRPTRSV